MMSTRLASSLARALEHVRQLVQIDPSEADDALREIGEVLDEWADGESEESIELELCAIVEALEDNRGANDNRQAAAEG